MAQLSDFLLTQTRKSLLPEAFFFYDRRLPGATNPLPPKRGLPSSFADGSD